VIYNGLLPAQEILYEVPKAKYRKVISDYQVSVVSFKRKTQSLTKDERLMRLYERS
jgi:hypothetical protein